MALSVASVTALMAIAMDLALRELPNRWHPVAWMGLTISFYRRAISKLHGKAALLLAGIVLVASGVSICWLVGWQIERLMAGQNLWIAATIQAVVLKQTLSIKSLARAASLVHADLQASDLVAARRQLAFHLVSRDTSELSESQVAAATIESVAENASDSFVAPLFYFALAGLPGALAYRFINTCDAMIGYRTERLEWLGKAAARLDDLANLIPARITAAIILVTSLAGTQGPAAALRVWWRDRYRTSSPNAGHPMSAAAGVLGVELEKVGAYCLGSGGRQPTAADIGRAIGLLWFTSAVASILAIAWLLDRGTQ